MTRIAVASIHPRPLSGQIEGLVGLAQALEAEGHSVDIISPFPSAQLKSPDRSRLANPPRRILLDQPWRITRVLSGLVRVAPHVDIIQLNLPTPSFSILADMLQALVRVPVVVGYEAHLVTLRDRRWLGRVTQAPSFYLPRLLINNRLVARLALNRAAAYVVSSHHQRAELIALGVRPDRIRVLLPMLPGDKLARPPRVEARSSFAPGRYITYIGHYNHVKGVDVLIRAFQVLEPLHPDLRLVLAWSGVGHDRRVDALLRAGSSSARILQMGQVCVPDLLAASDVVALPYRLTLGQAAWPAALLEAIAANVPIVTTRLPLLSDLTEEGKIALLVQPDDPTALAAGIERVLNDADLVHRMQQAQREWMQRIQPQRLVREYEQFYEQVIGEQAAVLRSARGRERV